MRFEGVVLEDAEIAIIESARLFVMAEIRGVNVESNLILLTLNLGELAERFAMAEGMNIPSYFQFFAINMLLGEPFPILINKFQIFLLILLHNVFSIQPADGEAAPSSFILLEALHPSHDLIAKFALMRSFIGLTIS